MSLWRAIFSRSSRRCSGHGIRAAQAQSTSTLTGPLQAVGNDVHVIGVSFQAAGHRTLVPQLIEALRKRDTAVYGPGTNIPTAAAEIMDIIQKRKKAAAE